MGGLGDLRFSARALLGLRPDALRRHALEGLRRGVHRGLEGGQEAPLRFRFAVLVGVFCHACVPMKKIEPLSPDEVRRHLEPFATEIGQATLTWNRLQENLAILFWYAIGPGPVPYAIWSRLSNDRTQRDILRVAIEAAAFADHPHGRRLTEEILWLLSAVDSLADRRNVAVHAPLTTLTSLETGITKVAPQDFFGNRRAKGLRGKDIIAELRYAHDRAEQLSRFAASLISGCVAARQPSWPERPSLLPPHPQNTGEDKAHRHQRNRSRGRPRKE
jgi:hypothetical protein